jgi:AcrR family transcriptional regulator
MNITDSREKILSSAIGVFAEKGKYRATVNEIASRAGVPKSLIRRSYPTKSDLYQKALEKAMEAALRQFAVTVGPVRKSTTVSTLGRLADASLDALFQNPDFAKIALHAAIDNTDEFLSVARNVKWRADGANDAAFATLFESIGARTPEDGTVPATSKCLLSVLLSMDITYLLGKSIAEVLLDMNMKNKKVFLDAMRRSLLDLWAHRICEGGPDTDSQKSTLDKKLPGSFVSAADPEGDML